MQSNLSLGVIDGVYPTTEWHVGTLDYVAWVVSDRQLPIRDNPGELCSQSGNNINIPEEPVDFVIIIGSFSQFPDEWLSCSKLKVVISIWPHMGGNRNRMKRTKLNKDIILTAQDFNYF